MKTIIISPNQPRGGTQTKNETIIIAPSQPRGGTQTKNKTIIIAPSQPRGGTRTKNKTRRGAGKRWAKEQWTEHCHLRKRRHHGRPTDGESNGDDGKIGSA